METGRGGDQVRVNAVFYFDVQPGETADESQDRLMCILDDLGIEYMCVGLPELIRHKEKEK